MEELTLNIQLSPLALKLRTLRLQKKLDFEAVSIVTKIPIEYLIAFETDKKIPTKEEKMALLEVLR